MFNKPTVKPVILPHDSPTPIAEPLAPPTSNGNSVAPNVPLGPRYPVHTR